MAKKKTSYKNEIVLTEEFFEIRLTCDTNTIDVFTLIKYLNQANYMVQGINKTLNRNFNVGYDAIDIEVFAVEHGSIRIPLKFKKSAANTLMGLTTTIVGGVAVNLISGNKDSIIIESNTEYIEAQPSIFLDNQQTKRSVGKIAKMVVEDDGISNLEVTYEKSDGKRESLTIKKTTLEKVAKECEDTADDIINYYSKTRLQIYGPILENTPSGWQVIMNGQKLKAFMTDKDFLEEMTAKKIAFAPGDEIIADIEEVISEDEQGMHIKRYIRKVHNYPKYTRVVKGVKQQTFIE